jgi:hypothetical protein
VNEVFGTDIPELSSSRAFGIHTAAIEQYPERFEVLKTTIAKVFEDPAYAEQVLSSGIPTEFIDYGDQDAAMAEAEAIRELAMKYESLLTGDEG